MAAGKSRGTRGQGTARTDEAARGVDGRVRRSRERVLRVASTLLSESGVGGISVDEVSRRSGVAKTTIYRHWPTRSDLVLDACSQFSGELPVPDTGTLDGDLSVLLATVAALLRTARWSSVMPSIIDAAERDPALAKLHSRIQRGHADAVRAVIERAMDRGQLPPDADPAALIAGLFGPLYYRRWFSREPLDEAFVAAVVRRVVPLPAASAPPTVTAARRAASGPRGAPPTSPRRGPT